MVKLMEVARGARGHQEGLVERRHRGEGDRGLVGVRIFGIDPGSERTGLRLRRDRRPPPPARRLRRAVGARRARPFPNGCSVIHAGLRDAARRAPARLRRHREHLPREERAQRAEARARARRRAARGVARRGVPIAEYTPAEIKRAVVGFGRAEKHAGAADGQAAARPRRGAVAARRRRRARRRDLPRAQRDRRDRGARAAAGTPLRPRRRRSWRADRP